MKDCGIGSVPNRVRVCEDCPEDCAVCEFASTGYEGKVCDRCVDGKFLLLGTCLSVCPTGMYADETVGKCENCTIECTSCFGGTSKSCYQCNATGGYIKVADTICSFPQCTAGSYYNQTARACRGTASHSWLCALDCMLNCKECDEANTCLKCAGYYSLSPNRTSCYDKCDRVGFKRDPTTQECLGTLRYFT